MPKKRNIYKGQQFWKLTVIEEVFWYTNKKWQKLRYIKCKCFCWNIKDITPSWLFSWNNISCWCWIRKKHWMRHTRIYICWDSMIWRCDRKTNSSYKNYWLRWITYDTKWKTFEWFYEDMKEWYEEHLTLDRENNDWDYSKNNCKWTTRKKQARNRRTNITYKWKCITEWCEELWLKRHTIYSKIKKWDTIEQALGLI